MDEREHRASIAQEASARATLEAAADLRRLIERVDASARSTTPDAWRKRRARGAWSAAECLEHLSATAEEASRLLRAAPERQGRRLARPGPRWWVRLFLRSLEPPARLRTRTRAAFRPTGEVDAAMALVRFRRTHASLARDVTAIAPDDLDRVCIPSPFGPLAYTPREWALVLVAHGRRHVWQAERALEG
jgi:hypothetical protein